MSEEYYAMHPKALKELLTPKPPAYRLVKNERSQTMYVPETARLTRSELRAFVQEMLRISKHDNIALFKIEDMIFCVNSNAMLDSTMHYLGENVKRKVITDLLCSHESEQLAFKWLDTFIALRSYMDISKADCLDIYPKLHRMLGFNAMDHEETDKYIRELENIDYKDILSNYRQTWLQA
ncbi:hypothetical protein [Yersinia ruckeri]|uniref:hypothetical protein n=1 Tax=Yersinia ruckeri TaxID=29486 RepID=UPI002238416D|nr:hypothetical protein [Yersinia ruckeri]MCW6598621.1 hypothetical protein [Yersinia ruckeri]